jgi:hypothetical protein
MAASTPVKVSTGDLKYITALIATYPGWVTAEALCRMYNLGVPWWAPWRRRPAGHFVRLLDEFVRLEWVEARWEHRARECGHVEERRTYRLVIRQSPTGPAPQYLLDMRAVVASEMRRL